MSAITLPTLDAGLQERLHREARRCSTCGLEIANPFTTRCPRCLTVLPVSDPGCSGCIHRSSCPVSSEKHEK